MTRLIPRGMWAAAALLGVLFSPHGPALANAQPVNWTASPDDALLLDVRLAAYRLGDGVRGYSVPAGACLVLSDMVSTLDLAVNVDEATGSVRGWAFNERNRFEIDRLEKRVRSGSRVTPLAEGDLFDTPEGWCVDSERLSEWLGVALTLDLSNAILFVKSDVKLPIELGAERKARAATVRPAAAPASLPRIKLPYLLWRTPSLDAVVTVGGIRDRRNGSRLDRRYELFASGEVARMSVDARLASDNDGIPSSLRTRAYRTDPEGGLLGSLRATHYAIGDVGSFASPLVGLSLAGRGALVTNRPVDRPDNFDRTNFRGELPSGWDAELYRNEQLLAFANNRSDGRYEFLDVPMLYGQNRFEIVLYGPQGQIRRQSETVAVGTESIPRGKTYYWAGFSQDDRDLIEFGRSPPGQGRGWRGSAGLEHGLDSKTSVAVQLHSLVFRDERLTYVEGAVRRAVGPALIEMSAAYAFGGGMAGRAQMLAQFGETYVSAESIIAMRGFRSDRIEPDTTGRHSIAIDHAFLVAQTLVPAHIEARYVQRRNQPSTLEAAARLSANIRNFSLTAGLDWQSQRARGRDPPDRLTAGILANGRIGDVRVRGEARYRLSGSLAGFEGATLVGDWSASDNAQWRAELGYDAFAKRGRASVGYSRRFDRFAMGVTGEAASDGSVAAGFNLAFSVGPSSRGGLRVTSSKLANGGSAIARVFRDLNEDGIRQANEPVEKGVQLTAGTSVVGALTDARGETIIDELTSFRAVTVGVDTTSLADPLIQPKVAGYRVIPRPGVPLRLDIPLVGAGEIEGTLTADGGGPIEGVNVELIDIKGAVIATQLTDFDGFFLFESVPYGEYTFRVAKLSAEAANLSPALAVRAKVGEAALTARLGTVIATKARQTVAAK